MKMVVMVGATVCVAASLGKRVTQQRARQSGHLRLRGRAASAGLSN